MLKNYLLGFNGFRFLFNFKAYKHGEIVLKILFLPVVLPVFTLLFLLTALLYTLERILAPLFQRFLVFQMRMIQKRAHAKVWPRRAWNLVTIIVTLVFLPIVVTYYISMLLKTLGKHLMKSLIMKLDFSVQYTLQDLDLFDDKDRIVNSPLNSMMNDATNTEDISKIFAQYFENHPELSDDTEIIEDDHDKNQS